MDRKKCVAVALLLLLEEDEEMAEFVDIAVAILTRSRDECSDLFKRRNSEGAYNMLINKHLIDDEIKFKEYFRLTKDQFFSLVALVSDDIQAKPYNRVGEPMSAEMKVAVTLRFLATGESYRSLAFQYRISASAISDFVPKVLKAIKDKLENIHLPPHTQIDWHQKAAEFWDNWDFPNCVAAIDGKHVRIVAPDNSGSLYHNFKGFFSIVLFAMVDANCKFLLIDVGSYGKEGDAGIFKKSKMGKLVQDGTIFPPPQNLPSSHIQLPFVVVGDEAFKLDVHVMKPYTNKQALQDVHKRHFNYALCRARRVSENAFGILCQIFRIFFTPINLKPETVDLVIYVSCCLHNWIRDDFLARNSKAQVTHPQHELPTENMIPLAFTGGFAKAEGFKVRSRYTEYFNGAYYSNKMKAMLKKRQSQLNSKE